MSDATLYDTNYAAVLSAIIGVDDRSSVTAARTVAHRTTSRFNEEACRAIRELPELTLESVLLLFGERP